MVGIIHQVASIEGMLRYNEQKISNGVACCIGQGNFPISHHRLSFAMKLSMLKRNLALRPRKKPAIHISLSFSPSENLESKKMVEIAAAYMRGIGFGEQPYLIYRHFDTAHPHMHICSVEVTRMGKLLSVYKARRFLSKGVIQQLEKQYGLVCAIGSKVQLAEPRKARIVIHGEQPVTTAIANVLAKVVPNYHYTNLEELNAVLRLYNIQASRGLPGSWLHKNRGLFYSAISNQGKPLSKPVKSSYFMGKPTLARLEGNFFINGRLRERGQQHVLKNLHKVLFSKPSSLGEFRHKLALNGIDTVFQKDQQGKKTLIYIDHCNGCVCKGSDLGESYSAIKLLEKWKVDKHQYQQLIQRFKVAESPKNYTASLSIQGDVDLRDKTPVRYSQWNQGDIGIKNSVVAGLKPQIK